MANLSLDLGCGTNKHCGSIGLDQIFLDKIVDVVHRIERGAYLPFRDDSFDHIYMIDLVEHIQEIPWLLSEVHRVATSGAIVEIRFPHYSHPDAHSDVTHVHRGFGVHALDHFDPTTDAGSRYRYYKLQSRNFPFRIEEVQTEFNSSIGSNVKRILCQALGLDYYEKYISRVIPLDNIVTKLKVVK